MNERMPDKEPEMVVEHPSLGERKRKLAELMPLKAKLYSDIDEYLKLSDFKEVLVRKYGNKFLDHCELLHFLMGSTPDPEDARKNMFFDFVGDDSVEKYLRDRYPETP